ncbi:hypothetical protein [Dongia deserti]|nr:hypothetical protein [Dongia deserti]
MAIAAELLSAHEANRSVMSDRGEGRILIVARNAPPLKLLEA